MDTNTNDSRKENAFAGTNQNGHSQFAHASLQTSKEKATCTGSREHIITAGQGTYHDTHWHVTTKRQQMVMIIINMCT